MGGLRAPGGCAVTRTAAPGICSAVPVLARPGRRAQSLYAGQHALEDHGQVIGEDFPVLHIGGPGECGNERGYDITPPPMFAPPNVRYALTTCAGPAAIC
jgi:hypothetical protein